MDNVNCGVKIDIEYRFVRNFFFFSRLIRDSMYSYRFDIILSIADSAYDEITITTIDTVETIL